MSEDSKEIIKTLIRGLKQMIGLLEALLKK
jgi:hypothetical protein